ncbi:MULTISPECIES: CorA family divalent cation transporter [unclassified Aureimonas]|uniref:CorA family divalent cation transporter n=1 Tax=unclassified Aureimonas TaxID=2615206 RepID=UPI0006F8F963|nr:MULTISPECIES: CorA family divalent cation transporter [unclassified Aureimonas]KQT52541.1 hypothetical protein ASG62_15150 [Aureimonas sp. Leaf427]KQT77558.1 hypothetical protein ASG54_11260 [Aureimonas sp. Leaf460]
MKDAPGRLGPSLIWAFAFAGGHAVPLDGPKAPGLASAEGEALVWLHLNLADQSTIRWIAGDAALPEEVRELLLGTETHARALVSGDTVACVVHDFEVDFAAGATSRVGALRFALAPGRVITARHHPLHAADVIRRRIDTGARPMDGAAALDLIVTSIASVAAKTAAELAAGVEAAEDALLLDDFEPDARQLVTARRRAKQLHRQLGGLRAVLTRLEEDEDLPEPLHPAVERLAQRIASLEGDVRGIEADIRLLRDELDLQAARRTNANLYVLSILSALLLPATLVTGFFGMNTSGMPFESGPFGTILAALVAGAAAFAVYLWLRAKGFLGGG